MAKELQITLSSEMAPLIVDKLYEVQDKGPPGEGWPSDEVLALIETLESSLNEVGAI